MTTPAVNKITYSGLARRIVQEGLLTEDDAKKAVLDANNAQLPFVSFLVSNNMLTAYQIAQLSSQDFGIPLLDLDEFDREQLPKGLIPEELIRKHHALPIYQHNSRLYIAVSDPTNIAALDDIKFHTGIITSSVLVEDDKLNTLIDIIIRVIESEDNFNSIEDADLEALSIEDAPTEITENETTHNSSNDAPVVRFVNKVLLDAIHKGASDIHFEPYEKNYRIRFRVDGVLYEITSPPVNLASRITARLKVMSKLDISERRIPQDGHMKMKISRNRAIDFRVSTCPMSYGEKVVLRILDGSQSKIGIEALGYEDFQRKLFTDALDKPQGMILVTGPTGSGKTVSLYTALNILNTAETNISTAEDPVELPLTGINQVQINPKAGLTFSIALRAFLRQDPDVIMVGETRDLETAEIAIKAAQTGHLVLSTLHTNSAPETLTRLSNMGIPGYNIATSVILIIAQRLARLLCNHCKKPLENIPAEILLKEGFTQQDIDKGLNICGPVGCNHCTNGYSKRTGIYEVLPITEGISRIIMSGGNSMQILDQGLKEGLQTLRRSALKKVAAGLTSLDEANRVTSD